MCVVKWRSRCSPREKVREQDGQVWVDFAGEVLVVEGEESMVGEKDGGEGSEAVGEWVRCRGTGAWAIEVFGKPNPSAIIATIVNVFLNDYIFVRCNDRRT